MARSCWKAGTAPDDGAAVNLWCTCVFRLAGPLPRSNPCSSPLLSFSVDSDYNATVSMATAAGAAGCLPNLCSPALAKQPRCFEFTRENLDLAVADGLAIKAFSVVGKDGRKCCSYSHAKNRPDHGGMVRVATIASKADGCEPGRPADGIDDTAACVCGLDRRSCVPLCDPACVCVCGR